MPTLQLDRAPTMWSSRLVRKLSRKAYRNEYVASHVRTWIALQVRRLRESRNWSQEDLGDRTNKPQSNISRIEDPDYGKLSLQTLFDLATAFDVALVVKFVDYRSFLVQSRNLGPGAMSVDSFSATAIAPQQYLDESGADAVPAILASIFDFEDATETVKFDSTGHLPPVTRNTPVHHSGYIQ